VKIGILGSSTVGQTLGAKLVELGHEVTIGTRRPEALDEAKGWAGSLREWLERTGGRGKVGTFAEAASSGEIVINATNGVVSMEALRMAGEEALRGKVLVEIGNELDPSQGMPPRSLATDEESLAERIQKAFPEARVVKTLNTVTAALMVDPGQLAGGDHTMFLCGNDPEAKAKVTEILESFGWKDIVDLGDITSARGMEMLMPVWLRLWGVLGKPVFNYKIVR
jgi:predicted dinucleotide-binding enzyme